jgi:hypothetical protein
VGTHAQAKQPKLLHCAVQTCPLGHVPPHVEGCVSLHGVGRLVVVRTASIAVSQLSMSAMTDVTLTQGVPPPAVPRRAVALPSSVVSQVVKVPGVVTSLAWHASSPFAPLAMAFALLVGQAPLPGSSVRNALTQPSTAASMSLALPGQAPPAVLMVASALVWAFVRQVASTGAAAFFARA